MNKAGRSHPPFDPRDVHHPLALHDDLKAEMVWREQRAVTQALTLHYNKTLIILEPTEISRPLAGKRGRPPLPRLTPIEAAQRMFEPV